MSESAIRVENLSKIYRLYKSPKDRLKEALHPLRKKYHHDFYALHDINFELQKGDTVGIVGRNGSGKSTLLKILTGVLTPSSGTIKVNGRVSALLELGAGFNPELSGIENVYFNGAIIGFSKQEMDEKIDDILSFADIGEFVHQPVKTYSSGMFARLAFAVAINVDPEILIVDEALSVGDAFFVTKCYRRINELKKRGITFLFVSHSPETVLSLCQNAILLDQGKCLGYDKAETIVNQYNKMSRPQDKSSDVDLGAEHVSESETTGELEGNIGSSTVTPGMPGFVHDDEFCRRVKSRRFGSGEARVVNLQLDDSDSLLKRKFPHGTKLKIRVFVEASDDIVDFNCGYFVNSDKGLHLTGSNLILENKSISKVSKNERVIVEYELELPYKGGIYSVTVMVSGKDASGNRYVIDWIDLAETFEVYFTERQYSFEFFMSTPGKVDCHVLPKLAK